MATWFRKLGHYIKVKKYLVGTEEATFIAQLTRKMIRMSLGHRLGYCVKLKVSCTLCGKGQPSNLPLKVFQNETSRFREVFLRFSSFPYSASSSHAPEPCFLMDQNFAAFEKGHPRNNPVKLFQNQTGGSREGDF